MFNIRILNPTVLSLLARVRHTNTLVIADRGFPWWPRVETVDLSLMDDVPTVLQVLAALRPDFRIATAYMAREFKKANDTNTRLQFAQALAGVRVRIEPHVNLKLRVPNSIGLIRTGDTTQYANVVLVSG
jgi:D-ribose pyranase